MTSPASSLARFARTVAPLLLLLVAGCPGDEDTPAGATGGAPAAIEAAPPPPTGPAGVTEVRSTKDPLPDEVLAAVPATLRPIDLAPVVRPLGPDDAIATGFVVELARAFAAPSQVGGPALDGTTLTIEPAVDGVLRVSTPTTLTFVPSSPLLPDTEYTVTLESVGTPHAVLRPGTPGQWSHTLRTPGFRVLRAGWSQVRFDENRAAIDVVFAGPVDVAAARERLTMTIDGARNPQPRVETTNDPAVLRLPLSGPAVKAGTRVGLSLAGGVPMQGLPGATAPAFKRAMTVPSVPAVNVLAIRRGEGPTGFFVDVICRDEAAPEGWNGWWDEVHGDWYELTSRCLPPDEGGAAGIRFSPPVPDVRVSPTRQGFRILGDFARGAYTVTLDSFTSKDGGVLPDPRSDAFTIPARAPQVQFVSKGRYLPSTAWKALPVRHLNLSQVQLEVRHVPERNLVHWLTGDVEAADARTSDLLVSAAVPVQGPTDDFGTTWLDLGAHVPTRTNGVYEVRVAGGAASDTSRVLVTSLHLVAKQAAVAPDAPYTTGLDVWAVHADTLKPVPGTAVDVRRRSGTVLGSCTTAAGGHCRVTLTPDPVDPEPPYVVLARHGEDLTYLRFEDLQTPLTEAAVDGEPYLAPEAYRVAMYSDRGVYRPGETAHLVGVVRGTDRRAPQKGMPLMMSLVDPRGRVLGRHTLSTDAAGVIAYDPEFGDWAVTGRYTAKVAAGDDELATYSFYVEEFVPERMEVSASLGEPDLLAGEAAFARIEARYLFGGSAEGSPAEVDCELVPATFAPTRNGQFTYGPWRGDDADGQRGLSLGSAAGELDKQGALSVACPELSAGTSWEGTGTLVARAVVFEAGSGRSTQSKATATVHPERFHIGLQTGTEEAHGGEPIAVSGVVVDWQGARTSGRQEVLLTAYRLEDEYGWWYDEDDGYGSYRRSLRRVEEGRGTVTAEGGAFAWTFTPGKDAAGFLIEARAGNAHTGMKVEGTSSYWWWSDPDGSADATPKPLKPGTLELTLPDSIKQGSKATATFTAPYAGRALLSVETADVRTWEWLDVKPGPTSWTFSVDQWAPNVYVSALLLKDPHSDSAETYMADRAFGVGSVRIDAAAYTQELVIRAPEEVRPNSELVVELELPGAGPDTVVTVAAIDEGILQLTGFETPDPLAQLLAKRALGVQSFETVGWSILVPPEGATSSTGGDAPDGDLGRAQPVEPVALWSGVVPVTKGKATVRFDVPQYRGKLRVMAVSAGPERVGHADGSVLVRDPLVVQATLPRFLMEGDRVDVPVFVTNMSKEPQDVVVSLGATDVGPALAGAPGGPPVDVLGGAERRMKLGIGASDTAVFEVVARRQVGTVQFEVQAKAGKLLSRAKQVVPFAPDAPRARVLHRVELTAGANDLSDWMAGWVPTTERTVLRVTSNPYGDVFDHLGYLVQYPYGCIEQTTSSTRPMLFVDRLLQQVDPEIAADHGISKRVNHGIRRVLSMQTGSGGFAYWPGSDAPHAWATAYATHMLLDARERGYDVPDASLDQALRWMESQVDAGASDGWRYGLPYMHYVLARAGRGRKALASSLLARIDGASKDGADLENTYLLQAALWQAGDRRHEDALRHPDVSAVKDERRNGWSFYSDRRRRGLVLTLFGELFGNDPDGEALAAVVASALQGNSSRWYTTQELVWGVTGLGRRISAGAKDFAVPVLVAGGTTLEPRWTDRDTSERAWEVTRLSERGAPTLTVESKGEGVLYALVASEGVQQGAVWQEGAEGIRVSRRYLTQEGAPIDPTGLSLGDLVVVRVDLRNTTAEDMRNVALVDRLPAGFEIENANLGRDRVIDVVDTSLLWQRDHMNVRDDRVEVFGTLPKGGDVSFTYAVRATSAGDFVVPPVEAEAMYDPRFWGREVGDRVVIQGPWTGISDAE
jgi:uncharacterized protein YfaS (alpha-2-macroglobulin family)